MKKIILCLMTALLAMTFAACENREATASDAPTDELSQEIKQEESVPKEPIVSTEEKERVVSPTLKQMGIDPIKTLEVYRFWEEGNIYSHEQVDFAQQEQTALAAANAAASVLPFVEESLPVKSIELQKSYIVIDFEKTLIEQYDKYQLMELQNTIATTFFQNGLCDSICFALDGDRNILGGENFQPSPFTVAEENEEDFKKITDSIPYQGISLKYLDVSKELYQEKFGQEMDDSQLEIAKYLALLGKLNGSAASPEELDMGLLVYQAIQNTDEYYSVSTPEDEFYVSELSRITDSIQSKIGYGETEFRIADHVEKNIQYLLGDDFKPDLSKAGESKYRYFPKEGVITPPHMCGGYSVYPIVKAYQEEDGVVKADVLYLFALMNGFSPWEEQAFENDEQMRAYIEQSDDIVKVTLKRGEDGRLFFQSCEFSGK